jgi:hypothetical protein
MEATTKERVETILNEIGISAFHLTQELGLSASTIYHVISGKNKLSPKLITAICEKYPQVNRNYLLKGIGSPTIELKASEDYIIIKKQEFEQIKIDIQNIYEILNKLIK